MIVHVAGASMSPTLAPGARVQLDLDGEPRPGDVVLIQPRDGGAPILHRLLLRLGPLVVHAGDHPLAQAGVARAIQVVARARVPRLPLATTVAALARSAARALARRILHA